MDDYKITVRGQTPPDIGKRVTAAHAAAHGITVDPKTLWVSFTSEGARTFLRVLERLAANSPSSV